MSRFTLYVLDEHCHETAIELSIRRDTVECWCDERLHAVFDREVLRAWLRQPTGVLATDEAMWCSAGQTVAVRIEGRVPWWQVRPGILDSLRARV